MCVCMRMLVLQLWFKITLQRIISMMYWERPSIHQRLPTEHVVRVLTVDSWCGLRSTFSRKMVWVVLWEGVGTSTLLL